MGIKKATIATIKCCGGEMSPRDSLLNLNEPVHIDPEELKKEMAALLNAPSPRKTAEETGKDISKVIKAYHNPARTPAEGGFLPDHFNCKSIPIVHGHSNVRVGDPVHFLGTAMRCEGSLNDAITLNCGDSIERSILGTKKQKKGVIKMEDLKKIYEVASPVIKSELEGFMGIKVDDVIVAHDNDDEVSIFIKFHTNSYKSMELIICDVNIVYKKSGFEYTAPDNLKARAIGVMADSQQIIDREEKG